MKKNLCIYAFCTVILLGVLIYLKINLSSIDILEYMMFTLLIPIILSFLMSLVLGFIDWNNKRVILYNVFFSIFFFLIIGVFNIIFIDTDALNKMQTNLGEISTVEIQSSNTNNMAGNITAILLFTAVSGIGTVIGKKIASIKHKNNENHVKHSV